MEPFHYFQSLIAPIKWRIYEYSTTMGEQTEWQYNFVSMIYFGLKQIMNVFQAMVGIFSFGERWDVSIKWAFPR